MNIEDFSPIATWVQVCKTYDVVEASRVCSKMSATWTGITSRCAGPRKPSTARNCAICPAVTKYIAMADLESVSSAAAAHTICIRLK